MTIELKVRAVGRSLGIVLPNEVLALLDVKNGDALTLTLEKDASVHIFKSTPRSPSTTAIFKSLNHRYQNALRKLAE